MLGALMSFPVALRFAMAAGAMQTHSVAMANALHEIAWMVVGAVVFFKSESIANFLFADGEPLAISASAADLQRVGFSVVAVVFGVSAVAELARLGYLYLRDRPSDSFMVQYGDHLVSAVVEVVFSVVLFFGSKGLSDSWRRLRARDVPDETE